MAARPRAQAGQGDAVEALRRFARTRRARSDANPRPEAQRCAKPESRSHLPCSLSRAYADGADELHGAGGKGCRRSLDAESVADLDAAGRVEDGGCAAG